MNDEKFWEKILSILNEGKEIVLVYIIDQHGSAPNVPGAKMFVSAETIEGTVGGGISEHGMINRARTIIAEKYSKVEIKHLEHNETAENNRSGMICSGSQTFALIPLRKEDKKTLEMILHAYATAENGVLTLDKDGISFEKEKKIDKNYCYSQTESTWKYQENIGMQNKLFIIGGGHVSLALSRIMETLSFYITVIDDRTELPTMLANIYAHRKEVVSYDYIQDIIPEGDSIYVTIMTFGHMSDEMVLEKIISKKLKYLGMMASKAKKKQIFSSLEQKGISKELLESVHSPIGLSIHSHSPEEIAISIAAEIIMIKNSK